MKKNCEFLTFHLFPKLDEIFYILIPFIIFLGGGCSAAMIEEFDLDQDGEINEQEFFAIMSDEL